VELRIHGGVVSGTVWNPNGSTVAIYSDFEGNNGRSTYAAIGGCYYSARLAICEQLLKERRQGTAIVLREARPGYIMPLVYGKFARTCVTLCVKSPISSTRWRSRFSS